MFANRLLRYEKFDAILRASRPRQTTPKTKIVSLKPRFIRSPLPLCVAMHRSAFIKFDVVLNPARFLAVAGGSTPPPTLLSIWRRRV